MTLLQNLIWLYAVLICISIVCMYFYVNFFASV